MGLGRVEQKYFTPDQVRQLYKDTQSRERQASSQEKKQIYEGYVVSEILDLFSGEPSELRILLLDPKHDRAPDVCILPPGSETHPNSSRDADPVIWVEVVSFTPYSSDEGLVRFFHRTKLRPEYAYPEGTVIVCHVSVPVAFPENVAQRISQVLSRRDDIQHSIMMLFKTEGGQDTYMAQVYPDFRGCTSGVR